MESIIKDQLLTFLLKHNLITRQQHSFLARNSTVTNILECLNDWSLTIKNSHSVDIAYIDYRKAFDSVSHVKLITKLSGYGLSVRLLNWIWAYLSDRSQVVCVDGRLSNSGKLVNGVPQGSVFGPVLFLLFINDVIDIFSPGVTARLFADDLKLYVEIVTDVDHFLLQNNLIKLEEWSRLWQLNISVKNVIF